MLTVAELNLPAFQQEKCGWVAVIWADMTFDDGKPWILGAVDGNPASSVFPGPGHQAIMPSKLGGWAAPALSNLGGWHYL